MGDLATIDEAVSDIFRDELQIKRMKLAECRMKLRRETEVLIAQIKKLKEAEFEEYLASKNIGTESIQSSYVDVAMDCLGTISTYSGYIACNHASIPESVAEALCNIE